MGQPINFFTFIGFQVLDKPVLVLVGQWEHSDGGRWDFIVEKNCLSQCIMINEKMTYISLKRHIQEEFAPLVAGVVVSLSYWPPTEMSVFSACKVPPVSINSDMGLETFFHLHTANKGLTLLVKLELICESECVPLAEKPTRGKPGIISIRDGTPSLSSGDGDASPNDSAVQALVGMGEGSYVGSTYEAQGVERSGIDLNNIFSSEIVAQLEQVEALAKEAHGKIKSKGKEKVTCEDNAVVDNGITQQWAGYSARDVEAYNSDFWDAVISKECRELMQPNRMEIGQPSTTVELEQPSHLLEFGQPSHIPELGQPSQILSLLSVPESADDHVVPDGVPFVSMEEGNVCAGRDDFTASREGSDEESELEEAIQLSLANIYQDIADGDVVPAHDCPPCLGDQIVETQEIRNNVYDGTNDAIFIGRVFRNKAEMQTALAIYAIKRFFNFVQTRSDPERLIVRCVDRNCAWRVFGHTVGLNSENIEVRTATLTHTCDISTRAEYRKKATCKVIAEVLKSKYANGKMGPRAADIPDLVLEELRVSISYMKAWHSKEKAEIEARGSAAGSYKLLMAYLHLLKQTNPGTVTNVFSRGVGTENCRFKYLFFALGACIHAVQFMRPVIIIDATTIKAKFRGCLMTASFQDGNFQIMPLGFGVVDSENEAAWTWFFKQLRTIVADSSNLVFVSDRHNSIYAAMRAEFPLAKHGACVVHLYRNVKSRFSRSRGLPYLVTQAATTYTVGDFREKFDEIERRSPLCANYLRRIGISHWTRVYFQGKRYNVMSSNVAESLNAALAKALEFPIVSMVETIRMMLMRWFCRRLRANRHASEVTPQVEEMLMQRLSVSSNLSVMAASLTIYQVNEGNGNSFTVDLQRGACTCKVFESLGIPCSHALAAARAARMSITDMVDQYYKTDCWKSAYSAVVMPVPNMGDAEVPAEEDSINWRDTGMELFGNI